MNEERITETPSWKNPRGQVMKTPDDVAEMLRLRACGWGLKRIARQLGCSHHTVKDYVATGGVKPFKSPERPKLLDGLEGWLRERFIRHRGNADVVRQDLLAEKGVAVSRRTLQRAVQPYRQALKAEALATTRFETPPGRQLQIDFGERLVEIGGAKIKAFVFVATLGHSRRLHVRAFRAEKQEHWFAGLESAFTTFGGVSEEVLMDNPRARRAPRPGEPVGSVQRQAHRVREALGLPSSRLRAVPGAHEGQDGEWRRLREEERDRGAFLRELGGIRGASRQVGA
jgi:transposase